MKVLFVTGAYAKETEGELRSLCKNGALEAAANTYQWAFIEGLISTNTDFEVVSCPFLPAFPMRFKQLYTPSAEIKSNNVVIGQMLSYNAFFLIKFQSIKLRLKKYLEDRIHKHYKNEKELWIISYTPYSFFTEPIIKLKKKYPNVKYCAIIADLVDDATNPVLKLSRLKMIQARSEQKAVWASYKHIDKFILLSKQMVEKIEQARDNNIVIEGLFSKVDNEPVKLKESNIKTLLYTGTLQEFAGILDLISAFRSTNDSNYRLIICGGGPLVSEIEMISKEDARIIYKGNLPREEVLKLQKQSTALINPRKPSVELTRYSFPSKTMEYMASGTPMIGYRLYGIPEEYYSHMYTPDDLTNEALARVIDQVLMSPSVELQTFGQSAKDFIRNNKESCCQVSKAMFFLQS